MRGAKVTSQSVRKDGMRVGAERWGSLLLGQKGAPRFGVLRTWSRVGVSGEVQDFASLHNRRSSSGDQ